MTMEETRETQQAGAVPAAYQPVYPAPPNPYYAPPVKAGRWVRFRRLCRLMLRRLWYGAAVVGRVLRPYAATLIVAIVLLSVIGWMSYLLWGPKPGEPSFQRAGAIPPAAAIETFMQGQQNFNADMMWDAYSTNYQAAQLASGASKATLQAMTTVGTIKAFNTCIMTTLAACRLIPAVCISTQLICLCKMSTTIFRSSFRPTLMGK